MGTSTRTSCSRTTEFLTFAECLGNGCGAWVVDAERTGRPAGDVRKWFTSYQVPTLLSTIEWAQQEGRSPQSVFLDFIHQRVRELTA